MNPNSSGQVVAGAGNIKDLERVLADTPILQQQMKPRHLKMIAVGAYGFLLSVHLIDML
jgi:amino acid permease